MAAGDLLDDAVRTVVERRRESQKYMRENYWEEFEDVQRAINCRTKPIIVKDASGREVEDPTRTNVCMPELWLVARKKKARLTANPAHINYTVPSGGNDLLPERLTALAYQQFDRSGEAHEHKRLVHQACAFGFAVSKVFWDKVEVVRQYRYDRLKLMDRRRFMELQGAPADEIAQAMAELGPELNALEIARAVALEGPELRTQIPVTKYEGPVVKALFFGDVSFDPRAMRFNDSDWVVEEYEETDLWLQKMARRTYVDPESGLEVPVFDARAMQDLLDMDMDLSEWEKVDDLKNRLRNAINKTQPLTIDKRLLRRKRFLIYEMHEADEQGRMWICWVGNEKVKLGRMPYPWDLYGKTIYTALTPMPNITSAIGDSSPRMLRYLLALHNASVGSRKDLVANLLRKIVIAKREEDVPEQVIDRALFRVVVARDPNAFRILEDGAVPPSAFEEEAQILRMMALAEPTLNTTDVGTNSNPLAGKLATTAMINARAADALTQDEVSEVELYFKELGEKKLWMMQQAQTEAMQVAGKYVRTEALSERYGKTSLISIDPLEIQEDIQVEPEAGSMLSVDDELRRTALMQAYQFAEADPVTWNRPYVASKVAATLKGVDAQQAINPPQPAMPPLGKINFNVSARFEELPAEVQNQMLVAAGLAPSAELGYRDTLKGVQELSKTAEALKGRSCT